VWINAEILANRVLGSLVLFWVTTFALADSHPRTVTNEISGAGSHSAAAPLAISKAEISASGLVHFLGGLISYHGLFALYGK